MRKKRKMGKSWKVREIIPIMELPKFRPVVAHSPGPVVTSRQNRSGSSSPPKQQVSPALLANLRYLY
jgi:hypothetical protein